MSFFLSSSCACRTGLCSLILQMNPRFAIFFLKHASVDFFFLLFLLIHMLNTVYYGIGPCRNIFTGLVEQLVEKVEKEMHYFSLFLKS